MEFRILGPLEVVDEGAAIPLGGRASAHSLARGVSFSATLRFSRMS